MKIPVTIYEKVMPDSHLGKLAVYSPQAIKPIALQNIDGDLYLVSVV